MLASFHRTGLGLSVCLALVAGPAYAADPLPGGADPARQTLEQPQRPVTTIEKLPEQARGPAQAPPLPADGGYILKSVKIAGATAISEGRLMSLYVQYLGKRITTDHAAYIADRITALYFENGYFLSKAYVENTGEDDGTLHIRVVEGYVSKLVISDKDKTLDNDQLKIITKTAEKIAALKPLHGPSLERYLLLLNDIRQINASTTLYPLPPEEAQPGAVGMLLEVSGKPVMSSVSFNTFGSRYIGPQQAFFNTSFATPFHWLDTLDISLLGSVPFDELKYGALTYTVPLTADGLTVQAGAGWSKSAPGNNLRDLEIRGDTQFYRLGLSYPLMRTRAESLTLHGDFELRNSQTDTIGVELFDDRLRVLSLGVDFDKTDTFNGRSLISGSVHQGLDILGSRKTGSINLSRDEGHSDFTKFNASIGRLQRVTDDWQLYGKLDGQYALDPLLSSEEYGYGGQSFGRAYDSSELLGDHGVAASIELRYNSLPPLKNLTLQPYAYYDIGKVWNLDTGSEPDSGATAGGGVRFLAFDSFSGSVSAAVPLTRSVDNPPSGAGKDPRVMFELTYQFQPW